MLRLDWNLLFTILNLLIWYFLLKKFLFKPINKVIADREAMIASRLSEAETQKKEVEALIEENKKRLAASDETAEQMIAEARKKAQLEADRIVSDAGITAEELKKAARKSAEEERNKALREVEDQITGLAMAATAKIMGDAKNQENKGTAGEQQLYDCFLKKAGESGDIIG